jgi:hypothetical protein
MVSRYYTERHETARPDEMLKVVNCRQAVVSRQRDNEIAIYGGRAFRQHDHAAIWYAGNGGDCALDVGGVILDPAGAASIPRVGATAWAAPSK